MIQLTTENPNTPPVSVNPAHVASVEPRRKLKPDVASQTPHLNTVWSGSTVRLADGQIYRVMEDYEEVMAMLDPGNMTGALTRGKAQIPGMVESPPEEPWIPDEPELKKVQEDFKEALAKDAEGSAPEPTPPPRKTTPKPKTTPTGGAKKDEEEE